MKKLLSLTALAALITLATLSGCKKEEQPTVNFNNATAEYIESFLGKPVEDFKKACEESGMMITSEKDGKIYYSNEINELYVGCFSKINTITLITYEKKGSGLEINKGKFIEYFNYVSNNNYAAFKGWNNNDDKNMCYKNITEYKNSFKTDITASTCELAKSANAVAIGFLNMLHQDKYFIEFASPEEEIYGDIKTEAMSYCN